MYAILRRRCGASLQIPRRRLSFFFFGLMSVLTRCAVAQNRRTVGLLDKYWAEAPGGSPRAGSISRNRVFRPRRALADLFALPTGGRSAAMWVMMFLPWTGVDGAVAWTPRTTSR